MAALISQLREKYDCDRSIAAALGISRQALSQAAKRGRLSESATIAAAALLQIDPGAALLANATNPANPPAPIVDAAPELTCKPPEKRANITNYAQHMDAFGSRLLERFQLAKVLDEGLAGFQIESPSQKNSTMLRAS